MNNQSALNYFLWPIISGALIGAVLLLTMPNLGSKKNTPLPTAIEPKQAPQAQWQGPVSYAEAVSKASPAVVNIYTKKIVKAPRVPLTNNPYFRYLFNYADIGQQERMRSTLGSGVIVSDEGYILTNLHVIQGAQEIVVQLQDGREGAAELVGVDKDRDLAVLRIDLIDLISIPIGRPDLSRVGDVVLAIGNPLGIGQSVSQGIISALGTRGISNKFGSFIQTDAAINHGNSGGALIDAHGNLLGINTDVVVDSSQQRPSGIGIAVPADIAMQTLRDIMEFGKVVTGWLGVQAKHVTQSEAISMSLPLTSGVIVTGVYTDSPALEAGLRPGDIIVKINNQSVSDGKRTLHKIRQSRPGDIIEMEVYRKGEFINLSATLGQQPETRAP